MGKDKVVIVVPQLQLQDPWPQFQCTLPAAVQGEGVDARHLGATTSRADVLISPNRFVTCSNKSCLVTLRSLHCYSISACLDAVFQAIKIVKIDNASILNTTAVVAA